MIVLVGARGDGWQINVSRKRWKIDLGIVSGQGSLGAWVMGMRPRGYLQGKVREAAHRETDSVISNLKN